MMNAEYARNEKALFFYYFNNNIGQRIYTCESFDIVSHEVGHAVLDGLKPHYIESRLPETGALHESFGDITAILSLLEQLDMCEAVIAHSKGDLHSPTFFMRIGEQMGNALGFKMGLRNADNNLRIDQVTEEIHDLSRVFTGAFFDILVEMFEQEVNLNKYDPAETLFRVGKYMSALVLMAFLNGPKRDAKFRDIAKAMMDVEKDNSRKNMFKKHFDKRKIFDWSAKPKPYARPRVIEGRISVCGTYPYVHDPEFRAEIESTFQLLDMNDNGLEDEGDDFQEQVELKVSQAANGAADEWRTIEDVEHTPLLEKKDM